MTTHTYQKAMRPSDIANQVGAYLKAGNLEGIVSLFHPDCTICFPAETPPQSGHDAVRSAFAPFLEIRPTIVSHITGEIINGDTALLQAQWRIDGADGSMIAEGHSTEVAKQLEDGSWVYFIDCPLGPPSMA